MSDKLKPKSYKQSEAQRVFHDVPGKTLIFWAREGLVEWTSETRDARGIQREYSVWNLYQIAIVRELTTLGASYDFIKWIMDLYFKDSLPRDVALYKEIALKKTVKASQSEVMQKMLILPKMLIGREGWLTGGPLALLYPPTPEEYMKHFEGSALVLLNLPAIARQVQEAIKGAGAA